MLQTTTNTVEGKRITHYYGIVSGETIIGANIFRDLFASIRDIVGGRSGSYEQVLREAKDTALREMQEQAQAMGANAVIGCGFGLRNHKRLDADGNGKRNCRDNRVIINKPRHRGTELFILRYMKSFLCLCALYSMCCILLSYSYSEESSCKAWRT